MPPKATPNAPVSNGNEPAPATNEALFAGNLEQGRAGMGEDPSKKYLYFDSSSPDTAFPLTIFENKSHQKRILRLVAQEMRRRGHIDYQELLSIDLGSQLAIKGIARTQALTVDTGNPGLMERVRGRLLRVMTPDGQTMRNKPVG